MKDDGTMQALLSPLIINLAPTGSVAEVERHPHVPIYEAKIVEDVIACARAGVSMVHLHVRDEMGKPCTEVGRFQSLISAIRATTEGKNLTLCVTTSGRHGQTAEQRAAVLDLTGDAKPDMASLTLSSMNFAKGASLNEPDVVRFLAKRMQERGIRPELEVFDLGMVHVAKSLIAEGLIRPPFYFNLILGNVAGAQPTLNDVAALVNLLPNEAVWSLGGIGKQQRLAAGLGCLTAFGVRIGLEDNLRQYTTSAPTTNLEQVQWLTNLVGVYGRSIATPLEVRQTLGLEGPGN